MDRIAVEAPQNNGQKDQYVYTGEQLLDLDIQEVPMLLEPLLPQEGVAAFAGSSDTGKSAFLRQLACAISE